ncbi:unnamed protein product [Larinioides sclopetarius]|uniref:Uncharacterized protein n=1 Tax=Larinioides sclopetarius TaxID=280406 RepID=A0AAV1ZA63_9ARAC
MMEDYIWRLIREVASIFRRETIPLEFIPFLHNSSCPEMKVLCCCRRPNGHPIFSLDSLRKWLTKISCEVLDSFLSGSADKFLPSCILSCI